MKKVSFNISHFCKKYGDRGAMDFAKSVGADCVDYNAFEKTMRNGLYLGYHVSIKSPRINCICILKVL